MDTKARTSSGSLLRSLVRFCLPLILSGVLQQLYNWADAFIVGNAEGDLALAAVGATSAVVNLYVNLITGFTLGLSVLFAHKHGEGDDGAFPKLLYSFVILLGGVFLLLSLLGSLLTAPLLRVMHTTADTFDAAHGYLKIIFIGFPFLAVYNVYSAALRGLGDSKTPFFAVLFSSVLNVGLDILFVYGLHAGVVGAAAATVISQIGMTVFTVIYGVKRYKPLRPAGNPFEGGLISEGLRLGLPTMLQSSVSSAGSLVLQRFMNGFGTATVTAITTAYRIDSVIMVPIVNLGSGISTLTAEKRGAGKNAEAYRLFKIGACTSAAVSVVLTFTVILTGGTLLSAFGAGEEAVLIGKRFFLRISCFYSVYGLATAIRSYLEGLGDVIYSSIAVAVSLVFRIITSYALAIYLSDAVIAYAEAFSWILLLLLYAFRLKAKRAAPPLFGRHASAGG